MTYAEVNSILVLGDSVSKGVVFNAEKTRYVFSKNGFIKKLTEKLRPAVFDCSKYGSTTAYGKSLLTEKLAELEPDLVLIEYGSNDCDFKWDEVALEPQAAHLPNLSLEEYTQNIQSMVGAIRAKGKIPILTNLHPLDPKGYFNWFTKGDARRQEQTLLWLKDVENIYWWQEMYSFAAESSARQLDVEVVNIRQAFLRRPDYKALLCADGIHPTEDGHALIVETFLEAIGRKAGALLE